ncbi:pre-mRNA-processing protein 45 [Cryptococcus sp. DSM 104549]
MAALARSLPAPLHNPIPQYEDVPAPAAAPTGPQLPKYGARKGWKPKTAVDFNGGGSYPECHIAQYPLDMGRKKTGAGTTLALQVDQDGLVRYDAIAQQGRSSDTRVQSSFKDLVPLANRTDVSAKDRDMERPDDATVADNTERTRLALERITNGKIKAAQPKNVPKSNNESTYIRYTPANQSAGEGKQRIIKMTEVEEDPLEPARFKHKKIPRGPAEPPPPVLQSPPRAATAQDLEDWKIPPCVSNWKNNKGFTIPLDKRLAADGRGLQDVHINDNFAKFSEALYIADRHVREEVRERARLQQLLAQKEKSKKEEDLRLMAQRAREERNGITAPAIAGSSSAGALAGGAPAVTGMTGLGAYGSDSESEESDSEEDEEAIREREQVRAEKRKEREKEMRMSNMGSEMRAKLLAKEANRDISEKIALGIAKPTGSKEGLLDSRLFNREALSTGFASEDSYNLYDKPLFAGSSAAAAIYKPSGESGRNDESFGGGTEEGIREEMGKDRFALGNATRGFEGADKADAREGPVQFERDTVVTLDGSADPFGVEQFMDAARKGGKRTAEDRAEEQRKRMRDE